MPITVSDGSHTIVVTFLNDAYGGSPTLDRNLYVNYVKYDGVAVPGAQATLLDRRQLGGDGRLRHSVPAATATTPSAAAPSATTPSAPTPSQLHIQ